MIYTIYRKNDKNRIDAIISFDCITSMDESWNATVTNQTVEYGFNITDNINIESPTYSISGVISSYSLFTREKEITWDGDFFNYSGNTDLSYHTTLRDHMIKIFSDRKTVTLLESSIKSEGNNAEKRIEETKSGYNKEIENCIITSLSFSYPENSSNAINVDMKLQKIKIAKVDKYILKEGEKIALLRPNAVVFEPYNGKGKKEESGIIDPVTGLPAETQPKVEQGNRADMEKVMREQLGLNSDAAYLDAVNRATDAVSRTRKTHSVIKMGDTYQVIVGRNAAALVTIGGVLDDNR